VKQRRHGPKPLRERQVCKHGHDLTQPGAIRSDGGKPVCTVCDRESSKSWRRNHREQWNAIQRQYRKKVALPVRGWFCPSGIPWCDHAAA